MNFARTASYIYISHRHVALAVHADSTESSGQGREQDFLSLVLLRAVHERPMRSHAARALASSSLQTVIEGLTPRCLLLGVLRSLLSGDFV